MACSRPGPGSFRREPLWRIERSCDILRASPDATNAGLTELARRGSTLIERKPVIGVAGGIGSGKSLVARQLASEAGVRIDADAIAHAALDRGDVRERLRQWWGERVFDREGRPDRRALAELVFDDPSKRRRLEGLVHPIVFAERDRVVAAAADDPSARLVVIDAPLLFEAGLAEQCDRVIYVHADRRTRLRRVAQQRGWDEAEVTRREKNQMPLDKKLRLAHYMVENDASEAACLAQIRDVLALCLDPR